MQSVNKEYTTTFNCGDHVQHPTFGSGYVEEFVKLGDDSIVSVNFSSQGIKHLMVKYANLKIMK